MAKPALLIIDMQNDFVQEGRPLGLAGARAAVPNIRAVLAAFRKRSLPVFHIMRVHRADGSDVEITRRDRFAKTPYAVEGTEGAAVITDLAPLKGEYLLPKVRMSAFIGTELDLILRTLGITSLFVCGIQTPNCIRATAFDAIAYNYPVVLVEDATGASSEEVHRCNIRDMQNIGIRVVRTDEVPGLLG